MNLESASDGQNVPDGQKADFAARAEKIHGIGPERARKLADEFADELTGDQNGTVGNENGAGNEAEAVDRSTENEKDRWSALRVAVTGAVIAGVFGLVAALVPVVDGLLKDDPQPQQPAGVDQEKLLELVKTVLSQSLAEESEQHEDEIWSAVERTLRKADAGDVAARDALDSVRRSGDTEKLLDFLEHEADQKLAGSLDDDYFELLREIAAVAYLRGDVDEALYCVEIVLKARPKQLAALNMRGLIHASRGELEGAIRCFESILELSSDSKWWQAVSLGNIGRVHVRRREMGPAEEMLLKALKIEKEIDHASRMASDYTGLGVIYQFRGELDRAKEMYNKSLLIELELGRKREISHLYLSLGMICQTRDDLRQAEQMHLKSLKSATELGHKNYIALNHCNLGGIAEK